MDVSLYKKVNMHNINISSNITKIISNPIKKIVVRITII